MRGFQSVGHIASGDSASAAIHSQEPGAECRLPLPFRDICEHSDTGVVITIEYLFLAVVGPGQTLSLSFWVAWQFMH